MMWGFQRSVPTITFLALAALACEPFVQAQSAISTGIINGRVEDSSGALIVGADVVITNTSNGLRYLSASNKDGLFSFTAVTTGLYTLEASAPGFRPVRVTDVSASVGQTKTINLRMEVGDVRQEVQVTAEAEVLNTSDSFVSSVVGDNIIQNLPTLRRQYTDFALLSPSVTVDGQFGSVSFSGSAGGSTGNYGRQNASNSFSVDGANSTSRYLGAERMETRKPYLFGSESVQEFQVSQNPYSPAYGGAIAGYVNTVTKSGTNAFHGVGFYYNRHSATGAVDAVSKTAGYAKALDVRQQFGAAVGGPIRKNKLFFFFDYEQQRRNNPITVLNPAMSNVSVTDFGLPAGTQLPAPTGFPTPSNLTAAAPGNPVYLQQVSNAMNQIHPNLGFAPRRQDDLIFFERIDWLATSKDQVALRYNYNTFYSPGTVTSNPVPGTGINSFNTNHATDHDVLLHWSHGFSPSLLLNTHTWFTRDQQTGIPSSLRAGLPAVRLTVPSSFSIGGSAPSDLREYEWGFSGHFSWIRGRHNFDFGSDINHDKNVLLSYAGYNGSYTFTSLTAFALGQYNLYSQNSGDPLRRVGFPTYQFYIGDTFKVSRKLTLNGGFRQDWQVYPQPPLNPALPLTGQYKNDYTRWAPRIGFAYNVRPGTVIRGGTGMFRSFLTSQNYINSTTTNGLASLRSSLTLNYNNALSPLAQSVVFPNVLPSNSPLFAASSNVDVIDPGLKTPHAIQASLQIEQQLSNKLTVTVGSIWVHSTHLISSSNYDLNLVQPTGTTRYIVCPDGTTAVPCQGESSVTLRNLDSRALQRGARFPGFGQVKALISPGNSNYTSGFIQFRQGVSHGFTGTLTYTVSRNVASNGFYFNDQFDFSNTKGPSMLDQRHRIVAGIVYQSSARNPFLANWMLSTSTTYGSGRPYAGLLAPACVGSSFSSCTGGSNLNDSAFNYSQGISGAGPSPNIGLHSLVGPWTENVDINVERGFKIGEAGKMMFRVTAFNAFNSPNYYVMYGGGLNQQQYRPLGPTCGDRATQNQTCYLIPNNRVGGFGTLNVVQQNTGPRIFQFAVIYRF